MITMKNQKTTIRDQLLSNENIFLAIYLVHSYIDEKELLSLSDQKELVRLKQIFDMGHIQEVMEKVRSRLSEVLDAEAEFFEISVYFKPKKYQDGQTIFRPLHTAPLIDQIAMIAMLQVLVYDFSQQGKLLPSELSRLLPSNFYGNVVSYDGKHLFRPWQDQYKKYTAEANGLLSRYSETEEYRYEVNLDLKNFFPSINPKILYHFICGKLPRRWQSDSVVLKILKKLLIFKLCELDETEVRWYLQSESGDRVGLGGYAKGLPQGLPHTYFLANLFMLLVQKEYEKIFPGRMVFYVDDSVIFTNGTKGFLDRSEFAECISALNNNICAVENQLLEETSRGLNLPEDYPYTDEDFGVEVHDNIKSTFSPIPDAKENSGEIYLHGLSREASNIGFNMYTSFSENELSMMLSRVRSILKIISDEINRIDEARDLRSYREKLLRYRRFFKYRETILAYREEGNIQELYNMVLADIVCREDPKKIQEFYEKYTDDILASAIQFTFRRCTEEQAPVKDLVCAVNELICALYQEHTNHSYIKKFYEVYLEDKLEYQPDDVYQALVPVLFLQFHALLEQKDTAKWDEFRKLINRGEAGLFDHMGYSNLYEYSRHVRASSDELTRMLLNAVYSYLFEYNLEDRFVFARHSRNPIEYAQIRILAALRNSRFSLNAFVLKYASDYTQDEFLCTADYSLLQVLNIFKSFVQKIDWIDQLILIHKYCCDTWKNGSKFLHFYTLHNQEHAVTLIQRAVEWLHAVSYFKLKQIDCFILFAACYLHDISMVSLPHTEDFYTGKNLTADQIYTDLELRLMSGQTKNKKRVLYQAYEKIDEFFEHGVRNRHAADSAMEIRKFTELNFLDPAIREFIARVSEAHGYDTADVYSAKSKGRESLINEKFIKILLRLSDLSDMSRYRISNVILKHNLTNLSEVSRFHWISHLITDDFHVSANHSVAPQTGGSKSLLYPGAITENLEVTVDVLMSQTTAVKGMHCKYVSSSSICKEGDDPGIVIICDQGKRCNSSQCIFLCKWFALKNKYLLKELAALKTYLNSVPDYFFASEAKVNVKIVSNTDIPNDAFDYLRTYVDNRT